MTDTMTQEPTATTETPATDTTAPVTTPETSEPQDPTQPIDGVVPFTDSELIAIKTVLCNKLQVAYQAFHNEIAAIPGLNHLREEANKIFYDGLLWARDSVLSLPSIAFNTKAFRDALAVVMPEQFQASGETPPVGDTGEAKTGDGTNDTTTPDAQAPAA